MKHGSKVFLRNYDYPDGRATSFMLKSDGTICPDPAKYPNAEDLLLGVDIDTGHTILMTMESECKPLVFSFRDNPYDQQLPESFSSPAKPMQMPNEPVYQPPQAKDPILPTGNQFNYPNLDPQDPQEMQQPQDM